MATSLHDRLVNYMAKTWEEGHYSAEEKAASLARGLAYFVELSDEDLFNEFIEEVYRAGQNSVGRY